MNVLSKSKVILTYIWLPVLLCLVWWFSHLYSSSIFFPSLQKIFIRFKDLWLNGELTAAVLPSMKVLAIGFFIALFVGVFVGVALGLSPFAEKVTQPFLDFGRSIPAIAVLPILIIMMGPGVAQKSTLIAFGAVWPILLNTIDGVRSIDPVLKDTAKSFRIPRSLVITKILIPGALPQIAVGIRTGLSIAVILMVGSEMFGSVEGLGHFIVLAQQMFLITDMWAGILLLGVIGYIINFLYGFLDKRILSWRPPAEEGL